MNMLFQRMAGHSQYLQEQIFGGKGKCFATESTCDCLHLDTLYTIRTNM